MRRIPIYRELEAILVSADVKIKELPQIAAIIGVAKSRLIWWWNAGNSNDEILSIEHLFALKKYLVNRLMEKYDLIRQQQKEKK